MTKKNWHICLLLLAAGLLAGCSDKNVPEQKQQNEIAVRTGVTGMQRRVATIDNNTELRAEDLVIDAYYHGTETKYMDCVKLRFASSWKFWTDDEPGEQVHYYWPFEGSEYNGVLASTLDFVGFCPYELPAYITDTTYSPSSGFAFTCDMSDYMTLASQDDLDECLVAVLPEQTYATQTDAGGALPLVFKHPFALIKFVITAASGTNVTIDSIGISELHTIATCSYDGSDISWNDYSGSAGMSLGGLALKNGTASTETAFFLVIPKNYGQKYLTVKATWTEWDNVTISDYGTDVAFDWEAGRTYTYHLTLDKNALKVDVEKFTEQW